LTIYASVHGNEIIIISPSYEGAYITTPCKLKDYIAKDLVWKNMLLNIYTALTDRILGAWRRVVGVPATGPVLIIVIMVVVAVIVMVATTALSLMMMMMVVMAAWISVVVVIMSVTIRRMHSV
jgi:hypothetical protein